MEGQRSQSVDDAKGLCPKKPCTSFATRRSLSLVGHKLLMPARGWLGSSADEGRAKLR